MLNASMPSSSTTEKSRPSHSFFTAGVAFWWFLIEPVPPRHRLTGPWSLAYLGTILVAALLARVLVPTVEIDCGTLPELN